MSESLWKKSSIAVATLEIAKASEKGAGRQDLVIAVGTKVVWMGDGGVAVPVL